MFMMKRKVVSRPFAVSDDLVLSVDHKICERWRFIISELSSEFPQISRTVLYEISRVMQYSQVLCKMASENAHSCKQN
jgi:hypothetical protein